MNKFGYFHIHYTEKKILGTLSPCIHTRILAQTLIFTLKIILFHSHSPTLPFTSLSRTLTLFLLLTFSHFSFSLPFLHSPIIFLYCFSLSVIFSRTLLFLSRPYSVSCSHLLFLFFSITFSRSHSYYISLLLIFTLFLLHPL